MDANELTNVRRQTLRDKRLTDTEISQTKEAAKNMTTERHDEPVLIMENFDNEKIEQMINKIRKGEKIIQQEKQTKLSRKIMNLNQKQSRNFKRRY